MIHHELNFTPGNYNPGLNNAVVSTGECYEEIGKLYEEQPRWEAGVVDRPYGHRQLIVDS